MESPALKRWLADIKAGKTTKRWVTKKGDRRGGRSFTRNTLYKLLTNVTYIGKIKYKDETHVGEHAAIVPVELFDRVPLEHAQ